MAECRLPRGVVFWANAVDHDCRNEARRYCRRAENGVALAEKHPRVHRNSPDRSSDLTRQPLRTPIANLCLSPAPTDAPKHSAFSVPNRHQTNHHPARPSIGADVTGHKGHRPLLLGLQRRFGAVEKMKRFSRSSRDRPRCLAFEGRRVESRCAAWRGHRSRGCGRSLSLGLAR